MDFNLPTVAQITTMACVQSLAWGHQQAMSMIKKKKKKKDH